MAVVAVRPFSATLKIADDRERDYTVIYEVESDSPTTDGPRTISSAAALPSPGTEYSYGDETDSEALCVGAAGDIGYRDVGESRRIWLVPVRFTTTGITGGSQDGSGTNQTIDGPWVVSGDISARMVAKLSDLDGRATTNSVGERFVPALEAPLNQPAVKLGRKTSTLDFGLWVTTVNAISSEIFWGQSAYTWQCAKWVWSVQWRGSRPYVQNDVELTYDAATWLVKPVDYGTRYIDPADAVNADGTPKYKYVKHQGEIAREGVFLDGLGHQLAAGADPVLLDGLAGRRGPFRFNGTTDFNLIFPSVIPGPITGY